MPPSSPARTYCSRFKNEKLTMIGSSVSVSMWPRPAETRIASGFRTKKSVHLSESVSRNSAKAISTSPVMANSFIMKGKVNIVLSATSLPN